MSNLHVIKTGAISKNGKSVDRDNCFSITDDEEMYIIGFLTGISATILALDIAVDLCAKKGEKRNICINVVQRKAQIRKTANGIPAENFKVYALLENKKMILYIESFKGGGETGLTASCKKKYLLRNFELEDIKEVSWEINQNDELVVELSLNRVHRNMSIKPLG